MDKLPIIIRECQTIKDFDECVSLQREAFNLPDLEISPRRHLIVSQQAGGWTLGAFANEQMIGFVHHLVARRKDEIIGYSHMMAIAASQQNRGIGAQLKWAQRERALAEEVKFIKWTWDPMQSRNAHFNLNRLGAVVRSYAVNFYGTDYPHHREENNSGIESDRLFAEWQLDAPRVQNLARGEKVLSFGKAEASVRIPANWRQLIENDLSTAQAEQQRVRAEFAAAFADNLICAAFERDDAHPQYLFFHERDVIT